MQEEELEDTLNKLQADITSKNIDLKSLIENNDQTLINQNGFSNQIKALKMTNVPFSIEKAELSSSRNRFRDVYREFSSLDQITTQQELLEFLSLGLKLLDEDENCPFCGDSKKENSEIRESVKKKINKIMNQHKLYNRLEDARNELVDFWKKLNSALIELTKMLENEMNIIFGQEKFIDLFEREKSLKEMIFRELLTTEYWERIKGIINRVSISNQDVQTHLILSEEQEIVIVKLIGEISIFKMERSEFFDTELSRISGGNTLLQKASIEREIEFLTEQLEKTQNDLLRKKNDKEGARIKRDKIKEIKNNLQRLEHEMSQYLEQIVDKPFKKIEPIVLEVMNDYLSTPYADVELKIEKKQGIKGKGEEQLEYFYFKTYLNIKTKDGNLKLSPDKYFNSFRYKLFCLMLKIAITISYRAQNKQNFPLIVDDIFSSSDYENRNNFSSFVKQIFELFEKYSKDLPLQLIIFTHDSLIFRSSMDAIYRMGQPYISTTKFAKLFAPEDRDSAPSIDNSNNRFWNLVRFVNEIFVTKAGSR
ncbi:hypothetical protein MASR2M39_01100 [Ignavibacteriales bacterium]